MVKVYCIRSTASGVRGGCCGEGILHQDVRGGCCGEGLLHQV